MPPASCRSGAPSAPPKAGSTSPAAAQRACAARSRRCATAGIRVSLFIAADPAQIEAAAALGAPVIEIHTGAWCDALLDGDTAGGRGRVAAHPRGRAGSPSSLGLEVHAGHGLDYASAETIAALPEIVELNIGHFLIGEAVFVGLAEAVQDACAPRWIAAARSGADVHEPAMILGIGSDITDIRRIAKVIERHGERFLERIFTDDRARARRAPEEPRRDLRQALRRQGGLRQGARHRHARRRVVARHGRGQSAVGAADHAAHRRGAGSACRRSRRRATRRASTSPSPTKGRWRWRSSSSRRCRAGQP